MRSALQVVERQYGTIELHGADPSAVRHAGDAVLELLGTTAADREPPQVVSHEIVTRIDPNQAQLVNRMRVANLLLEDETMFLVEVARRPMRPPPPMPPKSRRRSSSSTPRCWERPAGSSCPTARPRS